MKKLFIAAMLVAGVGLSAFAFDGSKVNYKVKSSFEKEFFASKNVSWTVGADFTKASFFIEDEKIEAFYSFDGESIGYTRQIDFKQLPVNAIQKIKKDFPDYKVTETIEFTQEGNKSYYVSLSNGNRKQILEVSLFGGVSKFTGKTE